MPRWKSRDDRRFQLMPRYSLSRPRRYIVPSGTSRPIPSSGSELDVSVAGPIRSAKSEPIDELGLANTQDKNLLIPNLTVRPGSPRPTPSVSQSTNAG